MRKNNERWLMVSEVGGESPEKMGKSKGERAKDIAKGIGIGAAGLSAAAMGADELADGKMQHTLDPVRENVSVRYTDGIQLMNELKELKKENYEAYVAKAKEEAIRREGGRREFNALTANEQAQAIQNVFQDFNDYISGSYSNLGEGGNEVVIGGIKYEVRDDQLKEQARREAIQRRTDENRAREATDQGDDS